MSTLLCCVAAVGLHLASYHSNPGFNNFNPGVYVVTKDGWTVGTYRNSEYRQSFYGGLTVQGELASRTWVSLTVGGITGYKAENLLPLAVPSLKYMMTEQIGARVAFVPRHEKGGTATTHLMLEYRV